MGHFYVTLPSDRHGYYFPGNKVADFSTKLATTLELEQDKWEVRLVEMCYPKRYKKRFLHNTLLLDSEEITFAVKHYESFLDLLTNIPRFCESSINEIFIRLYSKHINKYDGKNKDLFNSCRGKNSITINENVISYFPARPHNDIDDLAETV